MKLNLSKFFYISLLALLTTTASHSLLTNDCPESSCPINNSCNFDCCCLPSSNTNCCDIPCQVDQAKRDCKYDVMCKTHFSPRSQGLDTSRWLVGKNGIVHSYQTDQLYGDFSITAEFSRSFRRERIGKYFTPIVTTTGTTCQNSCCTASCTSCCPSSCNTCCSSSCNSCCNNSCTSLCNSCSSCYTNSCNTCCSSSCPSYCYSCPTSCGSSCSVNGCNCNCFTIGSNINELSEEDMERITVRGEDFGYSSTATVCMCPRVSNFIVDFNIYVGLTEYINGLFVELHLPVVHSWWENYLGVCTTEECSTSNFPSCLMSTNENKNNEVGTTNVKKALEGDFTWGDVKNKLMYGRIYSGKVSKTRLADLRMAVGYDVYSSERYRIGPKIVVAAPTGNVPKGEYMFEPIVGNGGHWELGGGLSAHAIGYETEENQFGFFLEAYVAHMFKSRCQQRTFDLKNNGCFSRYLLLKAFKADGTTIDGLERGPNVFTQNLHTQIDVQGDVSAMVSWKHASWSIDVGYNFWGRTREKIKDFCCCIPTKRYGIKGIAPMCDSDDPDTVDITTASLSTIRESIGNDGIFDADNEPVFVSCDDLDVCSALHPSAMSHAVFFHFNNTWNNEGDIFQPFFGVGGKVEFTGRGNRALDQWAVWAKGGVAF